MLMVRPNPILKAKGLVAENPRVLTKPAPNHLKWSMAGMETCSTVISMRGGSTLFARVNKEGQSNQQSQELSYTSYYAETQWEMVLAPQNLQSEAGAEVASYGSKAGFISNKLLTSHMCCI